ncbi:PKD domain-containing protein, partial [Candidatus Halocynthiibacter alkanivorans]|uniref:PKD domain-containing protein n=1 Tax=Candidatus Halocynthiibacter alkanivorans TaxID=2267619 RepID=UPI00190F6613
AAAVQPTFTAPTLGANDSAVTLAFSLVVADDNGNSSEADTVTITVHPPANAAPTADAGPAQINVASAATVTLDGNGSTDPDAGDTLTYAWTQTDSSGVDITLSNAAAVQPTFTAPTLGANDGVVTLTFSLVVTDDKDNSSEVDTVTITVNPPAPTPDSEFSKNEEQIREIIEGETLRSLNTTIGANQRMVREARTRFIEIRRQMAEDGAGIVSRNDIPFDVNGTASLQGTAFSTRGSFFELSGSFDGTSRRLFFGDFDIQIDGDTGSSTATVSGRMAWEYTANSSLTLGSFVGGELAHSNIAGDFDGDQDRVGLTFGSYAVHELRENLYIDGFMSFGAGRNNLEMANDVLALESDYATRTATAGAALTGVFDQDGYEFWPELAFTYGRTWIGGVDFTGRAYGLVDNNLSLAAGDVSIANVTLRPEFRIPLDDASVADSRSLFSFSLRLVCERIDATTTTEQCGGGAEFGFVGTSADGFGRLEMRISADRVGDSTRTDLQLNFERQF